jgi:hypothetical protein
MYQQLQQEQHSPVAAADGHDTLSDVDRHDVIKRDGKGTCTCTCETKPVVSAVPEAIPVLPELRDGTAGIQHKPIEKFIPQSAALMRTAANKLSADLGTKDKGSAGQKTVQVPPVVTKVEPAQAEVSSQVSKVSNGGSVIMRVPPMEYYVYDDQQQQQQQGEDEEPSHVVSEEDQQDHSTNSWTKDSRFPWKHLPDTMCFREMCESDADCCLRFNICDKSARVCVDCWYGSTCSTDRDCCLKYPHCKRDVKTTSAGSQSHTTFVAATGKCTNEQ